MSHRSQYLGRRGGKGVLQWTALLYLGWLVPGFAGELPNDIWNGNRGGIPSVTINRSGVSMTLPEQAIKDAGGGALASMAEGFLNRWAPEICSDLFDFQHSHQKMTLRVAIDHEGLSGSYREVIIDYRPSRAINCVQPENLVF